MDRNKKFVSSVKSRVSNNFSKMFIHKAYVEYYYDSQHKETILKPIERIPLVLRIPSFQEAFILRKPNHYLNGKPVFTVIRGYPLSIESDFLQTNKKTTIDIIENVNVNETILRVQKTLMYKDNPNLVLDVSDFEKKKVKMTKKTIKNPNFTDSIIYEPNESIDGKIVLRTNILEKRNIEKNSSFELDTWLQTSYNKVLLRDKVLDIKIITLFICCMIITALATWLIADNILESFYREKYANKKANLIIFVIQLIKIGVFPLVKMLLLM